MRESYCGLLMIASWATPVPGNGFPAEGLPGPGRANVWLHCFPGPEGFSLPEFRKGLEWFLAHTECPGCRNGRGLEDCPIRVCAQARKLDHCYQCPDLEPCDKYALVLVHSPT